MPVRPLGGTTVLGNAEAHINPKSESVKAYRKGIPITVGGASIPVTKAFKVDLTVSGIVTFMRADGVLDTVTPPVGTTIYIFAITAIPTSAATGTYEGLY